MTYDILRYMVNRIYERDKRKEIVLKGGTALLSKASKILPEMLRYTHDVDFHVGSEEEFKEVFTGIEDWLNSGTLNYIFTIVKVRELSGTSAGFVFDVEEFDGTVERVGIDLNIAPMSVITVTHLSDMHMPAYDEYTMLVDKLSAVLSGKTLRRVKDIYDIYLLLHMCDIEVKRLRLAASAKRPNMTVIYPFIPANMQQIEHAYDALTGISNKPPFEVIYPVVSNFIIGYIEDDIGDAQWNHSTKSWVGRC